MPPRGSRWRRVVRFDLAAGTLSISAARSKNGKARVVPLSRQAVELLERHRGGVDRLGAVFMDSRGKPLGSWVIPTRRFQGLSDTNGWTRHDLRRTAATGLGNLRTAPHIVELCLGHVLPGTAVSRVYNRSDYADEVRAALQAWADELDRIEAQAGQKIAA